MLWQNNGMHRIQVQLTASQERIRQRALRLIGAFSDQPDVARRHDGYLTWWIASNGERAM